MQAKIPGRYLELQSEERCLAHQLKYSILKMMLKSNREYSGFKVLKNVDENINFQFVVFLISSCRIMEKDVFSQCVSG